MRLLVDDLAKKAAVLLDEAQQQLRGTVVDVSNTPMVPSHTHALC